MKEIQPVERCLPGSLLRDGVRTLGVDMMYIGVSFWVFSRYGWEKIIGAW
jgi:hypothetical protein